VGHHQLKPGSNVDETNLNRSLESRTRSCGGRGPTRFKIGTRTILQAVWVAGLGCSATSVGLSQTSEPVVYGTDDRIDYFQVADPQGQELIAGAAVALVTTAVLDSTGGDLAKAPSWQQTDDLCPGEPFATQPAAAFCGGVLVDWDLVLTADHCTRLYALQDFKVVFDYFYSAPGRLAVTPGSVFSVAEIVNEELDSEGTVPRLDYAWLRLSEPVAAPRQPVPIYRAAPPPQLGNPVISVGTPGGVPVKWDPGGTVQDSRSQYDDYFTTNSDNSAGSSGGGAFDSSLTLTGITARGGTDFEPGDAGCNTTVYAPPDAGQEQCTYAFRALAGLCGSSAGGNSSLCRADCGSPCSALPSEMTSSGGCALTGSTSPRGRWLDLGLVILAVVACVRRSRGGGTLPPS
jgi:hypothetical protein